MDSLITAAARALASGDPLAALNRIALRDDGPALALRGIAMAQLGDLERARSLLRSAARAFGPRESMARARCVVAEAEIALVSRDLGWPADKLTAARATLEERGDDANAAHAGYLEIRRLLLIGRLDTAERTLAALDPAPLPSASRAALELVRAGIAMRRIRTTEAQTALAHARAAAEQAGIPALIAEVESTALVLDAPAARLIHQGEDRLLKLAEVEALFESGALVIDACRHAVRSGSLTVSLETRPVLFALARALGETAPADVPRETLLARAFGARFADESHRARLRVEIGRLRALLRPLAAITATKGGFRLLPRAGASIAVLARPVDEEHAAVLALLADGEAWSSSALALALGTGQRSVQRALAALADAGKVQFFGHGRARRWMTPAVPGFPTTLLLTVPQVGSKALGHARVPRRRKYRRRQTQTETNRIRDSLMKRTDADIIQEYGPFAGVEAVHGVTFDGKSVWFASGDRLSALDPTDGAVLRSLAAEAHAGTAFDGRHLFQIAADRIQKIDPETGTVLATIPAPGDAGSGLAWAEGALWVGQYRDRGIHQVDPETGAILRTIASNRFVTGVTWVDGDLWHGTWENDESELRRIDPVTGEVFEQIAMPEGVGISGLESDNADRFFCGGGGSGTLRAVRRPPRE